MEKTSAKKVGSRSRLKTRAHLIRQGHTLCEDDKDPVHEGLIVLQVFSFRMTVTWTAAVLSDMDRNSYRGSL